MLGEGVLMWVAQLSEVGRQSAFLPGQGGARQA
jgi:hypothetical protein